MIKLTNLDVKKMTIGQMARMNHISEQTLRLYDREGLLSPLGRDEKNGAGDRSGQGRPRLHRIGRLPMVGGA